MQFVVKYFSEIIMKSKPVRRQLVRQLTGNLRAVLRDIDSDIVLQARWDRLLVETRVVDAAVHLRLLDALRCTAGISRVLQVQTYALPDLPEIVEHVMPAYGEALSGRRFAVRCKRSGQHNFTSLDVERTIGAALVEHPNQVIVDRKST